MEELEQQKSQSAEGLNAVVDRWFSDHFHGSIVARDVDTYSHVHKAVEELKRRLAREIGVT